MIDKDERGESTRPNEGLPLTESKNAEDAMIFHYSRERRLERAPQSVRALYENPKMDKFNLLRPLISSKPRAMLFIFILILTAISIFMSMYARSEGNRILGGNAISVSAIRFEGTTIVVLKKKIQNRDSPYTGEVNIVISPEGTESPIVEPYRIFFTLKEEEEYRFALPFENEELLLYIQGEKDSLEFKLKAQ
jgi:hypothetical protein